MGGGERGVVASASYEARRCGVVSAMPVARARRMCPGLVVVPGDYERYEHFSRMMFSYALDHSPLVEVSSIDEGYVDLGGCGRDAWGVAEGIRRVVREVLRITLSEGVGSNKLVAQVASKLRKPDALVGVPKGGEREFLAPLGAGWLPGVGEGLAGVLRRAGMPLVGDVAARRVEELELFAGRGARGLWEFANGVDGRPVVPEGAEAKSFSAQETFGVDVTDRGHVEAVLKAMADRLFARVRAEGRAVRTVAVRVRYNDFGECVRSASLGEPTALETSVYDLIGRLLGRAWERRVSLRMVGLRLSGVYRWVPCGELALVPAAANTDVQRRLAAAVDDLRGRYGEAAVMRGHNLLLRGGPRDAVDGAAVGGRVVVAARGCGGRPLRPLLNWRSCYSFMDSLLTPSRIVELAAEAGHQAVGICDPNLHGAVEFSRAAAEAGLKAVIGAEVVVDGVARRFYARDAGGYANLCEMLSAGAVTGGMALELGRGLVEARCVERELRCAGRGDVLLLRILRAIRSGTLLDEPDGWKDRPVWSFEDAGEAPEENVAIAGECGFDFERGRLWFPEFHPPEACPPGEFLARLARRGLVERYGGRAGDRRGQLEIELAMIREVGYEEYFLTVWDMLQGCRRAGINWITRGSAADSLVCHCLGISEVDPVRFELYFQRFLNRERMALRKLPDIDLDFPHDRRDEVVERVFAGHRAGHVAAVGGFSAFKARSALAEIGKVLGMGERQVRRLTAHLPWNLAARDAVDAARVVPAAAEGFFDEGPARTALELAARLDGLPRHAKLHPCGVVLSRRAIHEFCPTFRSAKGWQATHFDMEAVEEVGLVKLDILAQGGLAVLRDVRDVLESRGVGVPSGFRGPWDDREVWEMVAGGNARGVHHIESPAMTSLERMCGCRDIDTLVAIVSVIRPGAANTLRKASFARRAMGLEDAVYAHPCLEPVLRSTHGVVAYEEHVLQIADVFAGMTPGRADVLRRALSKMRDAEVGGMRGEFAECARMRGRGEEEIEAVWKLVEGFRGYAFCRAHSTAYALEAWEAAWMKRWWPAEFLAAVLTHGKGYYSRLVYTLECRRLGIGFLRPDVNRSGDGFFVERWGMIRVPLSVIDGVGGGMLRRIGEARAGGVFSSLDDFVERTGAGVDCLEPLLRAGAFDGLQGSRAGCAWEVRRLARHGAMAFGGGGVPEGLVEPSPLERLRDEMEVMGFTVSAHPLRLWPDVAWETYCPLACLGGMAGRRVVVCGLVVADRTHHQVDGRLMKFMTLCDWSGMLETEMFAGVFRRFGHETLRHPVLEVEGVVMAFEGGGGYSLRVERIGRPRRRGKCGIAVRRWPGMVHGDGGRPLCAGRKARDGEESPDTTRLHAA